MMHQPTLAYQAHGKHIDHAYGSMAPVLVHPCVGSAFQLSLLLPTTDTLAANGEARTIDSTTIFAPGFQRVVASLTCSLCLLVWGLRPTPGALTEAQFHVHLILFLSSVLDKSDQLCDSECSSQLCRCATS